WRHAAAAMFIPYNEALGVHEQASQFTEHERWDFSRCTADHYPLFLHFPYFDLYRKQVVKQADLVLAMHLRGDAFTAEAKARNFAYYEPITVRDSSLSSCTQAVIAAEVGHLQLAHDYLGEAALMDLEDLEHNVREGVHMGSLAGGWHAAVATGATARAHGGATRAQTPSARREGAHAATPALSRLTSPPLPPPHMWGGLNALSSAVAHMWGGLNYLISAVAHMWGGPLLLQFGGGPCFLEAGDGLLGDGLADVLQHRLRRCVDQVLGLLEAELGELAHCLDHVDLALADGRERDRELGLLLFRRSTVTGAGRGRSRDRDRGRRLDAELVLDGLHGLDHVEDAPILERLDEILRGDLGCHD